MQPVKPENHRQRAPEGPGPSLPSMFALAHLPAPDGCQANNIQLWKLGWYPRIILGLFHSLEQHMELVTVMLIGALEKPGPWQEGVLQAETSSRSRTLNTFSKRRPTTPRKVECSLVGMETSLLGQDVGRGTMLGFWWESWTPPAQATPGMDV